jgi:hypothetical protein
MYIISGRDDTVEVYYKKTATESALADFGLVFTKSCMVMAHFIS